MLPDRSDNRNRSFINDIHFCESRHFEKLSVVSPSNTWFLTSSVNLNDSRSFLIQATLPICQTDTSLQPTSDYQISQFVCCSPDSKTLL